MNPDEQKPLPTNADLVASLANMRDEQDGVLEEIGKSPDLRDAVDHLVLAALRRSEALMDGFVLMVEHRNGFCAIPLVRLQLDSAMRVHAMSRVEDPTALGLHMLEGKPLGTFDDRNGERLTDAFLHQELNKKYEHVSDVYRHTSGFVHLSGHHLVGVLDTAEIRTSNRVLIADIHEPTPWSDDDVQDALLNFLWATQALLDECRSVHAAKSGGPST
jgi:hypothetical protein